MLILFSNYDLIANVLCCFDNKPRFYNKTVSKKSPHLLTKTQNKPLLTFKVIGYEYSISTYISEYKLKRNVDIILLLYWFPNANICWDFLLSLICACTGKQIVCSCLFPDRVNFSSMINRGFNFFSLIETYAYMYILNN